MKDYPCKQKNIIISEENMKTRKISRKLNLNKSTVSNLNKTAMNLVQGGVDLSKYSYCVGCPTVLTCDTCYPDTCDCTGDTYDTCNELMCGTVYPFACI